MRKLPSILFWSGFISLILSTLIGWVLVPMVVKHQVIEQTRIYNGSYYLEKWTNPAYSQFMNMYVFNVTNPSEVQTGSLPVLKECGPYVYEERRAKIILHLDEEKDTIKYKENKFFYFRYDLSAGHEDDIVTTINIPLVTVSQRLAEYPRMISYLIGIYLLKYKESLFVQRSVGELIYKGYYSKMVEELQSITGEDTSPDNMIAIFYGRNTSDEGTITIKAGNKNYSTVAKIVSWNEKPNLEFWGGEKCNKIEGTDAGTYPPFGKRTSVSIFAPDICRSLTLMYSKDIEYNGIPGYRFVLEAENFEAGSIYPDNECFCLNPGKNGEDCLKSGAIDVSVCKNGTPIAISFPHFLHAPYYLNKTVGLQPDEQKHTSYADIEPTTGVLLTAKRMAQVSVRLKRVRVLPSFGKVPEMLFPILWFNEVSRIDDETYRKVRSELVITLQIIEAAVWSTLFLSCIVIAASLSIYIFRLRKKLYYS